jgi:hypothetical protein
MPEEEQKNDRKKVIDAFIEGKKLDAYAEHRTKEMHTCWACGAIAYKRLSGVVVGARWLCLPCMRQLKEALDSIQDIEDEMKFQAELKKKFD